MSVRSDKAKGCMADRKPGNGRIFHRFIKRHKMRIERRRAKVNPECVPGYGRYNEYES